MLARRAPPAQIRVAPVKPTVVQNEEHRKELVAKCLKAVDWLKEELKGISPDAWMIDDIPMRDVMFTKNLEALKKAKGNPLTSRDSVKVLTSHNELKLLVDVSQSLMKILSQYRNFIPRIYVSPATYHILEKKGVLEKMRQMNW
jgi:hypothetical protein